MKLKYLPLDICLIVSCCLFEVKTQEGDEHRQNVINDCSNSSTKPILIDPKDLKNFEANSSVLVLVPSGINFTDSMLNNENFNLFKLNTDLILNKITEDTQDEKIDDTSETTLKQEDEMSPRSSRELDFEHRHARRFNLLRGLWNRPRSSPLYLVNGTVCRFVNATPICTTLSTSGLIRPGGSSGGGGGGGSGGGGASGGGAARPAVSGAQSSGSSVQFVDQNLNQRPRPAAIMDDDSQDVNVENLNNSTGDTRVVRNQQQQQPQQQTPSQPVLPTNYVVNRRPINLLAPFRRPVRQFMISTGRASDRAHVRIEQEATRGKVKRQIHYKTLGPSNKLDD